MTERGRHTARTNGFDVSPGSPRASASPALTEAALFRGYGVREGRPCACGSMVYADPLCPAFDVREHNEGAAHQSWRALA